MRLAHILLLSFALLAILMLLPLLWREGIELDKARFTEEWFKGCVRLLQILVAFMFANVLWQRHKELRAQTERQEIRSSVVSRWCTACEDLDTSVAQLEQATEDGDAASFRESKRAALEAFRALNGLADELNSWEQDNIPKSVRDSLTWLKTSASKQVEYVSSRLEQGEIVTERPLNEADQSAFKALRMFASTGRASTRN